MLRRDVLHWALALMAVGRMHTMVHGYWIHRNHSCHCSTTQKSWRSWHCRPKTLWHSSGAVTNRLSVCSLPLQFSALVGPACLVCAALVCHNLRLVNEFARLLAQISLYFLHFFCLKFSNMQRNCTVEHVTGVSQEHKIAITWNSHKIAGVL